MKIKKLLLGACVLTLAGCSSQYQFYPDETLNSKINVIESSRTEQSILVNGNQSTLEIVSLEEFLGPWISPKIKFTLTNKSEKEIMIFKASDFKLGFNNFWFPIETYTIIRDEEDPTLNFKNDDNFKLTHEVLPSESTTFIATFKTPKSEEYYSKKNVLIEGYTNLGLYNVQYKIKKSLKK